jgi:hypothetical protein
MPLRDAAGPLLGALRKWLPFRKVPEGPGPRAPRIHAAGGRSTGQIRVGAGPGSQFVTGAPALAACGARRYIPGGSV